MGDMGRVDYCPFTPATLSLASSTSGILGSASFQRERNFS